ncbi:EAL domain-containing protein [Campylobacter canadensis]|uniref:EAL domain-containing protein n=1 Tax=Campylobacter canadensis TaxID=449520 RepID=UPI001CCE2E73|nr:EAL domain-containing protein [Campylobacter canadensis]MBZ8003716.1 EAL domain-containing protein [Campylobacter canadensis]
MKINSLFSNSFRKFMAILFISFELVIAFYCYGIYKSEEKRIVTHHKTFNISEDSMNVRLAQNKARFINQFSIFSLCLLVLLLVTTIFYKKEKRKLMKLFNNFTKQIESSVIKNDKIQLEKELNYQEFQTISNALNQVLQENYKNLYFDKATSLPNELFFVKELADNKNMIVVYIYSKNYQNLLYNYNFLIADRINLILAKRLKFSFINKKNLQIAKSSGGDFLLAFSTESLDYYENIIQDFAKVLLKTLQEPIMFECNKIHNQDFCLGFDYILNENIQRVVSNAYKAALLASAKNEEYCIYSYELDEQISYTNELKNDLKIAIEENKLQVYYQPKFTYDGLRILGAEALVRWKRNNKFENTEKFIQIAENNDLIIALEQNVIRQVAKDITTLMKIGISLKVSINVSSKHIKDSKLLEYLEKICKEFNIPKNLIELEITERQKVINSSFNELNNLKNAGFNISVDDFGKEYSSFSYINELPVDEIKIDKSFVDGLIIKEDGAFTNSNSLIIIESIISLARRLNKTITAEGVEYKNQLDYLNSLGCEQFQGYYFQAPMPLDSLLEKYKNHNF